MTRFDTLKRDYCAYMGFSIDLSIYLNAAKAVLGYKYTVHLRKMIINQVLLDLNQKVRGVGEKKYTLTEDTENLMEKTFEYIKKYTESGLSTSELLDEVRNETGFDLNHIAQNIR